MKAPDGVLRLIERFDQHLNEYRSPHYNETQVRRDFIDPFFKYLGWDVDNSEGLSETYREVIHEDRLYIEGAPKAPDYCFLVGGERKFFTEAKKPSVNLKDDPKPAFQLRRYAWSAKLPVSILTDFEEFVIYDCRVMPNKTDKAIACQLLYLSYYEYADRWGEIHSLFSREAVLAGSLDKYAETLKVHKGTATVDDAFLQEISIWREMLARNIALRNPELNQRTLNIAVQLTIDRLIFLRICEDRGVENYERLLRLCSSNGIYENLCDFYRQADDRYNSGLFHFQEEKDRPELPDEFTLKLKIDDAPLKSIIINLYYPDSPYAFSVIPVEILGQVYEQFLGKVINISQDHAVSIEEKPEVRKAGGVYYTPTYVVDAIIERTIGKFLEGKTAKQANKLKILDPSCGSGSFLIGAYQYLLNWHLRKYLDDGVEKHKKELIQVSSNDYRLSTTEKKRILLNNIYGVDIDTQAVEVTKLSLLLKVLEGESQETLNKQLKLFHERALPDLANNIKCGNTLIGSDFYEGEQLSFFDEEYYYKVNAFDWSGKDGFQNIMKGGGFDIVIGNPPWGATLNDEELSYLRRKYKRVVDRMVDTYIYMIDKALQITETTNGFVGFIVPSTILNQVETKSVRDLLLSRGLSVVINLGQGVFGKKVLNTSTIFITSNNLLKQGSLELADFSKLSSFEKTQAVSELKENVSSKDWLNLVNSDPTHTLFTGNLEASAILMKLRQKHPCLKEIVNGEIQRGISPDVAQAHVLSLQEAKHFDSERNLIKQSISGKQIKRYNDYQIDQYLIYTTRQTEIDKHPLVREHLEKFRHLNTCKEVVDTKHPWYSLHRPRDPEIFESPKLIGITTSKSIELVFDKEDSLLVTDAMYVFKVLPALDYLAVMAILQSKAFLFLYRVANQGESRVIPQVKASKLDSLPFPKLNLANRKDEVKHNKLIELVNQLFTLHKRNSAVKTQQEKIMIQRQIDAKDNQINQLVYELYELSDEEIKIVEESI